MKLRDIIPIETRISMLQTATNVAASNYAGKSVKSQTVLAYAYEVYLGMIQQIKATEQNRVIKIKPPTPTVNRRTANKLLKKIAKKK